MNKNTDILSDQKTQIMTCPLIPTNYIKVRRKSLKNKLQYTEMTHLCSPYCFFSAPLAPIPHGLPVQLVGVISAETRTWSTPQLTNTAETSQTYRYHELISEYQRSWDLTLPLHQSCLNLPLFLDLVRDSKRNPEANHWETLCALMTNAQLSLVLLSSFPITVQSALLQNLKLWPLSRIDERIVRNSLERNQEAFYDVTLESEVQALQEAQVRDVVIFLGFALKKLLHVWPCG